MLSCVNCNKDDLQVFYKDLLHPDSQLNGSVYLSMQTLGPWGVGATSYEASPNRHLSRALATHWLYGALRAANSTVGQIAPPATTSSMVGWRDFGPSEQFFADAVRCADIGILPKPDSKVNFDPQHSIQSIEWAEWLQRAFGQRTLGLKDGSISRSAAAVALFQQASSTKF